MDPAGVDKFMAIHSAFVRADMDARISMEGCLSLLNSYEA